MQSPDLEIADLTPRNPDRILVDRYFAGDRLAGEEIYAHIYSMVRAVVIRVLGPRRASDWDDASQSAMLRILAKLSQWRGECPLVNYAAVVAARVAIQSTRASGMKILSPECETLRDIPSPEPGPASRAASEEAVCCLEQTRRQFPSQWQLVLELHAAGMNHDQIAQRVRRSRRAIQYWLAEMYDRLLPCLG